MDIRGFSSGGSWYKGNLHSHTTNSDGILSPAEAVCAFKNAGYSFLCLSDHDIYTDYREEFNSEDFILLPGFEASAILYEDDSVSLRRKTHHMNAILGTEAMQRLAVRRRPFHKEELPVRRCFGQWDGSSVAADMARDLYERGFIVTYNHPVWSMVELEEFSSCPYLTALEIFNYNTVNECACGSDTRDWDSMLRKGSKIWGFASDDNHNQGLFDDAFGGWITVKALSLTHDNIINAIIAGNYYSSSGPEIFDWGVFGSEAYVSCSRVERINFIVGNHIGGGRTIISKSDDGISNGCCKLEGGESYVRAECVDKYGRTAWSNPIFLK